MPSYLGIDTSNYTTSVAAFNNENDDSISVKKLLDVKKGKLGLRQSDAVFLHVKQLSSIIERLFSECKGSFSAVGVSKTPRDIEGSYMPCFEVGLCSAEIISTVLNIPLYTFSHQSGHIAAALYSAKRLDLIGKEFIAFHVSGGTTEALLVKPDNEKIFDISIISKTLDLNAGQVIDRVGTMLGLKFPCGTELENLALKCNETFSLRPSVKDNDCCLSGLENQCRDLYLKTGDKIKVSGYLINYIMKTLDIICSKLLSKYGDMPIVFAGGVMSNSIIRDNFKRKYNALFAEPAFSSDNAMGIAVLTSIKAEMK